MVTDVHLYFFSFLFLLIFYLSSHVCLSLSSSLSLFSHVCLSLFSSLSLSSRLSLFISILSLFSLAVPLHFYLFLCSLLFLSLFSFTTLLFFSLALSPLSLSKALFSQLSDSVHSFSRHSLSVRKSLTCPESQSAPALAHPLNGYLLASRGKNLHRSSVVCVVVCVVYCGVCCGYVSQRFMLLLSLVRACLNFSAR